MTSLLLVGSFWISYINNINSLLKKKNPINLLA